MRNHSHQGPSGTIFGQKPVFVEQTKSSLGSDRGLSSHKGLHAMESCSGSFSDKKAPNKCLYFH